LCLFSFFRVCVQRFYYLAQRVVPLPHKPTGGKFVGHQYGGQLLSFPAEILLEEEPARAAHSAFERTVKSLDPTAAPVLDADHIPDRTTVLTATGVQKVDPAVINALANMMFPSTSTASSAAAPSPALKLPIQVKLSAKQKLLVDQLHRYLASSAQSNSESSAELISLVGHPIIIRGASDLQSAADTVARALQERAEAEQRAAVAAHAAVLAHRVWTSTNSKPPSLALTSTGAPHTGVSGNFHYFFQHSSLSHPSLIYWYLCVFPFQILRGVQWARQSMSELFVEDSLRNLVFPRSQYLSSLWALIPRKLPPSVRVALPHNKPSAKPKRWLDRSSLVAMQWKWNTV
jgi:hypothetical protein